MEPGIKGGGHGEAEDAGARESRPLGVAPSFWSYNLLRRDVDMSVEPI